MLKKIFKFGPKKEDIIEIWCSITGLKDVIPVQTAGHFIPKWYENMPKWNSKQVEKLDHFRKNVSNKGTVKRCPAIPEFMSMGFVVPLWCDLRVKIFDDGSFEWNTPEGRFKFSQHPKNQLGEFLPKHAQPSLILKPDCPWYIKTPPGVSMFQFPMFYHFNPDFEVAPGVIWTDIHHEINQQMMFKKKGEFLIQRGTPLAQYIPYRRENFSHEVKEENKELITKRWTSYFNVRTKFTSGYQFNRQRSVKERQAKCPYPHGGK